MVIYPVHIEIIVSWIYVNLYYNDKENDGESELGDSFKK